MLTDAKKQENKMMFIELLSSLNIDLTPLMKYLDAVDYFEKPATAQYFRSYPGGLCSYALDVYNELARFCNAYYPGKYSQEDVVKVALFKDIYRAELYTWGANSYKVSDTRPTFGELGFSSYMIAKYFVTLTDEQIEAIVMSRASEHTPDLKDVMQSYPLVTLTKLADTAVYNLKGD